MKHIKFPSPCTRGRPPARYIHITGDGGRREHRRAKYLRRQTDVARKGIEQRTAARAAWRKLHPPVRAWLRRKRGGC